jgi:hypothetical protein
MKIVKIYIPLIVSKHDKNYKVILAQVHEGREMVKNINIRKAI